MASSIRVPEDVYKTIRHIRITLEGKYEADTPSFQDFDNVALERLISEWDNPNHREQILSQLLARGWGTTLNRHKNTQKTSL